MNWIMIVGAAVFVVILIALVVPSRKDKARADDRKSTTTEVTDWLRGAWARAEEAIGAHHKARGAEVGPARERMLRLADEIDAEMREIERTASVSERQMLMLKVSTEEIREFVNDALARHPEGQQN